MAYLLEPGFEAKLHRSATVCDRAKRANRGQTTIISIGNRGLSPIVLLNAGVLFAFVRQLIWLSGAQ